MKILGIALLCVGFLCAVAGIVSLFLLPRTTLKGVSEATLARETLQEMGYQVISVEERGEGRVNFNISAPKNTNWSVLERKIVMRVQEKLRPRDRRGMFAGFAGGFILVCLGGVAYKVGSRRRVFEKRRKQPRAPSKVVPIGDIRGNGSHTPVVQPVAPFLAPTTPEDEWTRLLDRVRQEMELVQGEVKAALEDDFADLLAETGAGRRIKKAWHLLGKIQNIREVASQQSSEAQDESNPPIPSQPVPPTPSLALVLKALLPIDEYVPSTLKSEVVRAVICWGFLRPRDKTPYFEGSYTSRDAILTKTREFPLEEIDEVLRWLVGLGVVRRVHARDKEGRKLFSVRIHAKDVDSPGSEIIQIIVAAAYQRARMG